MEIPTNNNNYSRSRNRVPKNSASSSSSIGQQKKVDTMHSSADGSAVSCVVCCHPISIFAYGKCEHLICYECSTRIRVLCEQNTNESPNCPICRAELPRVVFMHKHIPFEELDLDEFDCEGRYQIYFEDASIKASYNKLLQHRCPRCENEAVFETFHALRDHVLRQHERFYCDLCVDNLHLFTSERKVYSRQELGRHNKQGDQEDTSYRGHPLCEFCKQRYFDKDELYRHSRKEHHYCHFCEEDGSHVVFRDIPSLKNHFREEHFLCEEGSCKDEDYRYVAFKTTIDGKAHLARYHSKELSKAQRKQVRTLGVELRMPPRPKNHHQRNGVVTREDYEDFHDGPRRGNHHYNRSRRPYHSSASRGGATNPVSQASTTASGSDDVDTVDGGPGQAETCAGLEWFPDPQLDMKSEQEFPQLGSVSSQSLSMLGGGVGTERMADRVAQNVHRPTATVRITASTKPFVQNKNKTSIDVRSEEDFPVLKPSKLYTPTPVAPPPSSSSMSSQNSNRPRVVSVRVSSNTNPQTASRSSNPSQAKPKTFEEDFPALGNAAKPFRHFTVVSNAGRTVTTITSSTSSNVKPSEAVKDVVDAAGTAKKKAKKKKTKTSNEDKQDKLQENRDDDKKQSASKVDEDNDEEKCVVNEKESDESDHVVDVDDSAQKVKETTFAMDDFPALPSTTGRPKVTMAPPGFSNTSSRIKAPPGFSNKQCLEQKSVPGVTISLSSVARQLTGEGRGEALPVTTPLTFMNSNGETFQPLATRSQPPQFASAIYAHPANFQKRNQMLITRIQKLVGDDERFKEFRSLSMQFRKGNVTANEYFEKCVGLLGIDSFMEALPELLVLLPDINKQQELLLAYQSYWKKRKEEQGTMPKKCEDPFLVCATCRQVLVKGDFKNHMMVHDVAARNASNASSIPST